MHCDHKECRQLIIDLLAHASKRATSIKEVEEQLHRSIVQVFVFDVDTGKEVIEAAANAVRIAMDARELLDEYITAKKEAIGLGITVKK